MKKNDEMIFQQQVTIRLNMALPDYEAIEQVSNLLKMAPETFCRLAVHKEIRRIASLNPSFDECVESIRPSRFHFHLET